MEALKADLKYLNKACDYNWTDEEKREIWAKIQKHAELIGYWRNLANDWRIAEGKQ